MAGCPLVAVVAGGDSIGGGVPGARDHIYTYLSAYARQPARGPTMLAYVGVCWPILRAMWAHLVAMLAHGGLMLTHVEPEEQKNGNSKKNTVKRRIF